MGDVPRELFVPAVLRGCAYGDEDLALGGGRFLIEPLALAKLLQAAAPASQDVVLVIGDVTGYAAAVSRGWRARCSRSCRVAVASLRSMELLAAQGGDNVVLEQGPPDGGLPEPRAVRPDPAGRLGSGSAPGAARATRPDGRLVGVVEHGRSGKVTLVRKVHGAMGRVSPVRRPGPPASRAVGGARFQLLDRRHLQSG